MYECVEVVPGCPIHAKIVQIENARLLVQQTQHHPLSVAGGQGRYPHVDRAAGDTQGNPAILRQPFLGNIERSHHLDPRHDGGVQRPRRLDHVAQRAVDTEAHNGAGFEHFHVNIGSFLLQRLGEQGVDEADDGRIVLRFQQVGDFRQFLGERGEIGCLAHVVDQPFGVVVLAGIDLA